MSGNKRRYEAVQPEVQRDIVADYQPGVRGHGHIAIAKKHGPPVGTVQHVLARAKRVGADPVAPRGHKKRKLDRRDEAKLYRRLDQNPFATNRELAALVGEKISERTVSLYLARAKPSFTAKVFKIKSPKN